jgi:putative ABC transport system ATP-binding protein
MLKVKNLCKFFHKNTINEKKIFENLNFVVKPGEFVTIIGGNGAGKSTLMNLITGSQVPDSGEIFIDSKDVTYWPEHKRARIIGNLFQNPLKGTAPNMTIEENLLLAKLRNNKRTLSLGLNKNDTNFFKEKLAELDLNLENRLQIKVGLLSGGQRQALTLLMAIISKPKILILDEHTAALDPVAAEKILSLTNKIVEDEKITTLMITHNLEMAFNFGSRTIMFNAGEIVADLDGQERENISKKNLMEFFYQSYKFNS